jgi:hypothetical protein
MSTTFSVTRDTIITAALKECGAFGTGETPSPEDFSDASLALNIIIKSWVKVGMPLWKVVEVLLPLTIGNATYQIGPTASGTGAVVTDRPLRILNAFIRTLNGKDVDLLVLSRQEYEMMGDKSSTSIPNSFYFQPLIPNSLVTLWPAPSLNTSVIHLFTQVPISDVNAGTDIVDFPSECYQALKWCLAAEIGGPYVSSMQKLQRIEQKAAKYKDEMEGWSVEEASIYFGVDSRGR